MSEDFRSCMEYEAEEYNYFDLEMVMRYQFWKSLYGGWHEEAQFLSAKTLDG